MDQKAEEQGGANRETSGAKTCQVGRYLIDEPVELTDGTPHRRIANELVRTLREADGARTIALCGNYGSGKSTIVQHINRELEKSEDNKPTRGVFVFDGWAHRDDSLHLAFVKALWDHVRPLAKRRIEQEIESANTDGKQPSFDKKLFDNRDRAVSKLIDAVSMPTRPRPFSKRAHRNRIWAIVASACIVIAASLTQAGDIVGPYGWTFSLIALLASFAWIVVKASKDPEFLTETDQTIPSITPQSNSTDQLSRSTLDAQKAFKAICAFWGIYCVSAEAKALPLVIVLEDLDRFKGRQLEDAWRHVRVFTDMIQQSQAKDAGKETRENLQHVRLIVPLPMKFDRAIDEKLFQVRVDVPPFAIADWEELFRTDFAEAFGPAHAELTRCIDVMRSWVSKQQNVPAPREILRVVNDARFIAQTFASAPPPIAHVLFYVLLRKTMMPDEIRQKIIDSAGSLPFHDVADLSLLTNAANTPTPNNLLISLAKLIHGVDDEGKAYELILEHDIHAACKITSPADRQAALAKVVQHPQFWPVMKDSGNRIFKPGTSFGNLSFTKLCELFFDVLDYPTLIKALPKNVTRTDIDRLFRLIGYKPDDLKAGTIEPVSFAKILTCHADPEQRREIWRHMIQTTELTDVEGDIVPGPHTQLIAALRTGARMLKDVHGLELTSFTIEQVATSDGTTHTSNNFFVPKPTVSHWPLLASFAVTPTEFDAQIVDRLSLSLPVELLFDPMLTLFRTLTQEQRLRADFNAFEAFGWRLAALRLCFPNSHLQTSFNWLRFHDFLNEDQRTAVWGSHPEPTCRLFMAMLAQEMQQHNPFAQLPDRLVQSILAQVNLEGDLLNEQGFVSLDRRLEIVGLRFNGELLDPAQHGARTEALLDSYLMFPNAQADAELSGDPNQPTWLGNCHAKRREQGGYWDFRTPSELFPRREDASAASGPETKPDGQ